MTGGSIAGHGILRGVLASVIGTILLLVPRAKPRLRAGLLVED